MVKNDTGKFPHRTPTTTTTTWEQEPLMRLEVHQKILYRSYRGWWTCIKMHSCPSVFILRQSHKEGFSCDKAKITAVWHSLNKKCLDMFCHDMIHPLYLPDFRPEKFSGTDVVRYGTERRQHHTDSSSPHSRKTERASSDDSTAHEKTFESGSNERIESFYISRE